MARFNSGRNRSSGANVDRKKAPVNTEGLFFTGQAGRDRLNEEIKTGRAKRELQGMGKPFRFSVKPGADPVEFVILDDEPNFYLYEHTLQDAATGYWNIHITCLKATMNCPVCETGVDSSYILALSVIDTTPFTDSKGVTHEFSRKLLIVKQNQQSKFIKRYQQQGTLRGALFESSRETSKQPSIGQDVEFIEMIDPDELTPENFTRHWTNKDGVQQSEDCSVPFNYMEVFKPVDPDILRAHFRRAPEPGSVSDVNQHLGSGRQSSNSEEQAAHDDSLPWDTVEDDDTDTESAPASKRTSIRRSKAASTVNASSRPKSSVGGSRVLRRKK